MSRKIHRLSKLQWAEFADFGPFKSEPKLKGKAREGIVYQERVGDASKTLTGNLTQEQWIRFKDSNRVHYCRPDIISENWDRVLVIEAKLSLRQFQKGVAQLRLYKPILEFIFNKPTVCVLVFKHWIVGSGDWLPMLTELQQALYLPKNKLTKIHGLNFI